MKVLLVDDSGTMRTIQKRYILKMGVAEDDIVEADNGQKGLEAFQQHKVDLVVADWNMPVMDGLALVKEIRKQNDSVPIIMITTESERSRVVTAIQAGVSDYLVKPFTSDALQEKFEKWVGTPA